MASKFNTASSTATKSTRAPSRVKKTVVVEDNTSATDEAMRRYMAAHDEALSAFNVPSKTRIFVACLVGMVAYAASLYWGIQAAEILTIAVVSLTGIGFITYLVWFLGMVVALISAMVAGWQTAKLVLDYVPGTLSKIGQSLRDSATKKTSLVRGWFAKPASIESDPVCT